MCCMKESRLRLMNARGNVHPCIYESPHSSTFGFGLIFFPFYNPFSASRHLTKSPIVYFIIRRIQACASPGEHVIDWLYHPAIIFTLYSLVDAPALNHQQATPHPLFFSLSLSSSSNIPHTVSAHLYWRIIFCGINFNSPFNVRFHLRTQFSG